MSRAFGKCITDGGREFQIGRTKHDWYLLAFDPVRKEMRTFALKHVTQLQVLKSKFERNPRFNERDHLGGGFGVWINEDKANHAHEIRIRFDDFAALMVAERM